jgi:hypothetical protein
MGLCDNDPPDPSKGYIAGAKADLETMQQRRAIEVAAMLGRGVNVRMPGAKGDQAFDFTGFGDADFAANYGDQLVGQMLQIQRDLGPAYVEQRLAELEMADPEGAAMRRRLWDVIKTGVEAGPTDRPDLQALQDSIMQDMESAGTLSDRTRQQVSQGVLGGQVARGNYLGNAAASEEAGALVRAGEAQRAQRQAQAMAFLTGQLSPADAAQRESQQNMANLGAFIGGETPQAQFGQLSGAQGGAAPFGGNAPGTGADPAAGLIGMDWQNARYAAQQQQVNPWIAGIGGAFGGVGMYYNMGGGGNRGVAQPAGLMGGWQQNFGAANAGQV